MRIETLRLSTSAALLLPVLCFAFATAGCGDSTSSDGDTIELDGTADTDAIVDTAPDGTDADGDVSDDTDGDTDGDMSDGNTADGDTSDADMEDPCADVTDSCTAEGVTCDGNIRVACAPDFDGCLVETRSSCITNTTDSCDDSLDPPQCVAMDACLPLNCDPGSHCEVDAMGNASCVVDTCTDIMCSATERCVEAAEGNPAFCEDISCTGDGECALSEFCNGTICVSDVCSPGARQCNMAGDGVEVCDTNGSGYSPLVTCSSPLNFSSVCQDDMAGNAACTCQDDWDCPTWMTCEAGLCAGTGMAPTCSLPPVPFQSVPPNPEIVWGTPTNIPMTVNSPVKDSSMVVTMPVVANLDDDNGDGFINELDFPEIVFISYWHPDADDDARANGILRAIHGGGSDKGLDYFAACGNRTWQQGTDPNSFTCGSREPLIDATSNLAVGDLDADGVPEIVAIHEMQENGGGSGDDQEGLLIYDNEGQLIVEHLMPQGVRFNQYDPRSYNSSPSINLADLDADGTSEIVVGRFVFTYDSSTNPPTLNHWQGSGEYANNNHGIISCIADLDGDGRQEVIAGSTIYGFPRAPAQPCDGSETAPEDVAYCTGALLTLHDQGRDGFCAIADVMTRTVDLTDPQNPVVTASAPGPNNPLDGTPEVILVSGGDVYVYAHFMNGGDHELAQVFNQDLNAGNDGGAPNIDDFDGDSWPEIGTAASTSYVVVDLQPADSGAGCPAWNQSINDGSSNPNTPRTPSGTACTMNSQCGAAEACGSDGTCICAHNGWRRSTDDSSSRTTGSSVFDFNGDGAAEVVYNDECFFRIYDGLTAEVLFREPSESRTRNEYPVVADVDNDGNAEIVFPTTNEPGSSFCNVRNSTNPDTGQPYRDEYNSGIEVWGDPTDTWVSARRIWNQHAYHVTNVRENGAIPAQEPQSWLSYNGRSYNTYRSQPRSTGVAPDLVVGAVQLTASSGGCGALGSSIDIIVRIENQGDLRVGPGVDVTFNGTWGMTTEPLLDAMGNPLSIPITTSIGPGGVLTLNITYDQAWNGNGGLPDSVQVIVDEADLERECIENNNSQSVQVQQGNPEADLRVELATIDDSVCPADFTLEATVFNDGAVAASNVEVRYYRGDPSQGGTVIGSDIFPGPIAAGGMATRSITVSAPLGAVTIWAVVDPDDAVAECNDGNNATAGNQTFCNVN